MVQSTLTKPLKMKKSNSLGEKAYNTIKQAIISYKIKPEEPLIEEQLAKKFNISRTPVREALKKLQNDGLVKIIPNKGAFVAEITKTDIEEVFILREILECTALKTSIYRLEDSELFDLGTMLEKAEAGLKKGDCATAIESDIKLHGLIVNSSGYKKIPQILDILNTQTLRIRYVGSTVLGRMEQSTKEHKTILDALKRRDLHLAEALLVSHIRKVRDNVLSVI